jgi:hypothetical protein
MRKSKAAILVGMGLMTAASYVNAAHAYHVSHGKKAVEISIHESAERTALISSDDWGSPAMDAGSAVDVRP